MRPCTMQSVQIRSFVAASHTQLQVNVMKTPDEDWGEKEIEL